MSFYGQWELWKITYYPKNLNGGIMGVAIVEAGDQGHAMQTFREQYSGQYSTVASCKKLSDCR